VAHAAFALENEDHLFFAEDASLLESVGDLEHSVWSKNRGFVVQLEGEVDVGDALWGVADEVVFLLDAEE
jgi:hypothetical protein